MSRRQSMTDTVELLPVYRGKSPGIPDFDKAGDNGAIYQRADRKINRKTQDWRLSLFTGAVLSVIVLLFNMGFILWAVGHSNLEGGRGTLYTGRCDKARRMSLGFHLVINILATILLGASNYAMQCLCAPTRSDIDKAHQKRAWLDIGVPSLRNLFTISKKNAFLWVGLSLSTLPLHLVYNSTVFLTLSANSYYVFAGNSSLTMDNFSLRFDTNNSNFQNQAEQSFSRFHRASAKGELSRLSNSDCIDAYATMFQSRYNNLILVTEDINPTNFDFDVLLRQDVFNPYNITSAPYPWICDITFEPYGHPCSYYLPGIRSKANNWTIDGYHVDYCLAENSPDKCELQYSIVLAIVVIIFNLIKAIIICLVAFTSSLNNPPILTSGDAIASFMQRPDEFTNGNCLATREFPSTQYAPEMRYYKEPRRWKSSVSPRRWTLCLLSYTIAILIVVPLLCWGLVGQDTTEVWSAGLGAVTSQTIIHGSINGSRWPSSLIANTIIANTPQAVFSILYFASNAVFTAMSLAAEWSDYSVRRKGLRVSTTPLGSQRSTYFLSLPYRYALPLTGLSALIHWLISQSLFLVAVHAYDPEQNRAQKQDITSCGFSPVGIVAGLSVIIIMLSYLVGMGFRRFRSGMPVAGSCSLAMAAACHPRYADIDCGEIMYCPLKWGAEPLDEPDDVGHCTFSSEEVEMPENGCIYS